MKKVIRIKSPLIMALGLSMLMASSYLSAHTPSLHSYSSQVPNSDTRLRQDLSQGFAPRPAMAPPRDSPLARYYRPAANDATSEPPAQDSRAAPAHLAPTFNRQAHPRDRYYQPRVSEGAYIGQHPAHADLSPRDYRQPPRYLRELEREIALNRSYLACNPQMYDPPCASPDTLNDEIGRLLPSARYPYLPRFSDYEWRSQGQDLLLVERETSHIHARFHNMVP